MPEFYPYKEHAFYNSNGDHVQITINKWTDSDPGVSNLNILSDSDTIKFTFGNEYGDGVLIRRYRVFIHAEDVSDDIIREIQNEGILNYRLDLYIGENLLFRGYLDPETVKNQRTLTDKNPEYSCYFVESPAVHQTYDRDVIIHFMRERQEELGDNQITLGIPVTEILNSVYNKLGRNGYEFIFADPYRLEWEYDSEKYTDSRFFHKLQMSGAFLPQGSTIKESLQKVAKAFNLRIGYSHLQGAVCAFEKTFMATGGHHIDDYNPHKAKPEGLLFTTSGVDINTQTVRISDLYYDHNLKTKKQAIKVKTTGSTSSVDLKVERFNNTIADQLYKHNVDRATSTFRFFYPTPDFDPPDNIDQFEFLSEPDNPDYKIYPYFMDMDKEGVKSLLRSIAALQSIEKMPQMDALEATIPQIIDPVTSFVILNSGGLLHQQTHIITEGEYNIRNSTTYMKTKQIGDVSSLSLSDPSVSEEDWNWKAEDI